MQFTTHGGAIIYGRSDATLKPGGVRIGTAEIYRQVEQLPEVLESLRTVGVERMDIHQLGRRLVMILELSGHHVRVVEDESRHRPVFLPKRGRQERLQVESLRLLQIGRVLHYAIADDARKAHADGLDGLAAAGQLDLGPDRVPDVLDGHHLDLRLGAF